MNLYLRMLLVYWRATHAGIIRLDSLSNQLSLRVLPNDLDIGLHVNNGRFLTLCDLSRLDLFIRTGLLTVMKQRRWAPLVAYHTMSYKASLTLFQNYSLEMTIKEFDEKYFYCLHTFSRNRKIIVQGDSHAVIRGKEGVIPPGDVIAAVQEFQDTRHAT